MNSESFCGYEKRRVSLLVPPLLVVLLASSQHRYGKLKKCQRQGINVLPHYFLINTLVHRLNSVVKMRVLKNKHLIHLLNHIEQHRCLWYKEDPNYYCRHSEVTAWSCIKKNFTTEFLWPIGLVALQALWARLQLDYAFWSSHPSAKFLFSHHCSFLSQNIKIVGHSELDEVTLADMNSGDLTIAEEDNNVTEEYVNAALIMACSKLEVMIPRMELLRAIEKFDREFGFSTGPKVFKTRSI
ncbi:unnamed protein product [Caenorhabditis auriculariae]|uniref:MADF domain-containing protein n=1 Tax=Caenorhabditis auriculariae TaxID=2777116 RepID=A0A8S1H0U9_9PELO|nr:unnamed protein product [Caenorhabditis auriculariae]